MGHPDFCKGLVDRFGLLVVNLFDDLHVRAPAETVQEQVLSNAFHIDLDQVHADHLVESHGLM